MKLTACIYIDDDGLGGELAIYDSPCSAPACLHASLPLSPGEVATLLEYIAHGVTYQKAYSGAYYVSSREVTGGRLTFYKEALSVQITGELDFMNLAKAYVANLTIPRENVLVDMSNEWTGWEDNPGDIDARAAIEDIE